MFIHLIPLFIVFFSYYNVMLCLAIMLCLVITATLWKVTLLHACVLRACSVLRDNGSAAAWQLYLCVSFFIFCVTHCCQFILVSVARCCQSCCQIFLVSVARRGINDVFSVVGQAFFLVHTDSVVWRKRLVIS